MGKEGAYPENHVPKPTDVINLVWDLGSGGKLAHMRSVQALALLRRYGQLPSDDKLECLSVPGSNYLTNPYALGLMGDKDFSAPQHTVPWLNEMRELHRNMQSLYTDIEGYYTVADQKSFPEIFTLAAQHKLATMMALTLQLCFDAHAGGRPIPLNYVSPTFKQRGPAIDRFVNLGAVYQSSHEIAFHPIYGLPQRSEPACLKTLCRFPTIALFYQSQNIVQTE